MTTETLGGLSTRIVKALCAVGCQPTDSRTEVYGWLRDQSRKRNITIETFLFRTRPLGRISVKEVLDWLGPPPPEPPSPEPRERLIAIEQQLKSLLWEVDDLIRDLAVK